MFQDTPCIAIPFKTNDNLHPSESEIVALYLYFVDGTFKLINFSHPDALISEHTLSEITLHPHSLVLDKKFLSYHRFYDGIDLNSYLHYYIDDIVNPRDFYTKTIETFNSRYYTSKKLNQIIPLSKLIELAENIILYTLPYFKPEKISDKCVSYCNDFVDVFSFIEATDILVGDEIKKQNYMWYTATSRPSNSWNGFNFSAMNKNDGTRNKIKTVYENGKIVQFDYDAFHIKLLADILDYKFSKHPYEEITEQLNLTIPYDEVKVKVFQNIYGNITEQFLQHPFFQRVQAMIDELYEQYQTEGYIESHYYGKRFREIEDPTPNKVFNYFLQSLETEYNVLKIKKMNDESIWNGVTILMYLYDAFVFDIPPEKMYLITDFKTKLESDGMTTKCSIGDNFGDMKLYL